MSRLTTSNGLAVILAGVSVLFCGCGGSPGLGNDSSLGTGGASTGGATSQPNSGGNSGGSGGITGTGGVTGTGGHAAPEPSRDSGIPDIAPPDAHDDRMGGDTDVGGAETGDNTANITVWLAGDSTVADGANPCPVGWGKSFQALFNPHVTVSNSAQGGRSVQTWLYDVSTTMGPSGECVLNSKTYLAPWTAMLAGMKTGDYLFVQFGINDATSTCNRHVGTAQFQTYLGMMAQAAKDRGAHPIFVTPVSSIACSGAKAVATRGSYAAATRQAGVTYKVPVIDLEQLSVALYTSLGFCPLPGPDAAKTFASGAIGAFFCEDHTHFEAAGASQIGILVAKALRDQSIGLASYLR